MKRFAKIGLFGGSFDPVHNGHLVLAQLAKKQYGLQMVVFIPAKMPPHKLDKRLTPAKLRLRMLSAAIKPHKYFSISLYELGRASSTYTYQTIAHFKRLYPGAELFFIIGTDSLLELKTWKKAAALVKQVRFLAGRRPGAGNPARSPFAGSVEFIRGGIPEVSSTLVRRRAFEGLPLEGLVPAQVEKIIAKERIYAH